MKLISNKLVHTRTNLFAATCICLFVLSLVFPVSNLRAEDRPAIKVNFEFEGQLFERIPEEKRAAIKAGAEEKVCELAEERWGFLGWSNEQMPEGHAIEWNMKLKVEVRQITNDAGNLTPATIATLSHSGQLAADRFPFQQTEENETIYPISRPIPFTDPDALADDVSSQLDKQLVTLLESTKVKTFLENIPIVERVIADADKTRIVVPLKTRDLRTDVDSILRVKFRSSDNKSGSIDLETAEEVLDEGQYAGYVVGLVKALRLSPIIISTPTWWDDQLLTVIGSASEVKVYMETYNASPVPGAVVVDGIVSDPEM